MLHTIMISIHLKYYKKSLISLSVCRAHWNGEARVQMCEAENDVASAENDRLTFSGVLK